MEDSDSKVKSKDLLFKGISAVISVLTIVAAIVGMWVFIPKLLDYVLSDQAYFIEISFRILEFLAMLALSLNLIWKFFGRNR